MPSSPMPTMDSQRVPVQFAPSAMRVLILGGTTEASVLARLIAGDARFDATLSLAGRTTAPRAQPIATRIGGFGGADAMAQWLRDEKIEAVVDATHPYADQISANAVAACKAAGLPLASIVRPPWTAQSGDNWQSVPSADAAAGAIGETPRRVFLSLGRQELGAFAKAPQHHYLGRSVDQPQGVALPPDIRILLARGPFAIDAETRLLRDEKIEVLVSKNSGGTAIYAKIAAARTLGLRVLMIARPDKAVGHPVQSEQEAIDWLLHDALHSPRGV
jgi:precorrin-6A/cobalt-precorrin-6A reductase